MSPLQSCFRFIFKVGLPVSLILGWVDSSAIASLLETSAESREESTLYRQTLDRCILERRTPEFLRQTALDIAHATTETLMALTGDLILLGELIENRGFADSFVDVLANPNYQRAIQDCFGGDREAAFVYLMNMKFRQYAGRGTGLMGLFAISAATTYLYLGLEKRLLSGKTSKSQFIGKQAVRILRGGMITLALYSFYSIYRQATHDPRAAALASMKASLRQITSASAHNLQLLFSEKIQEAESRRAASNLSGAERQSIEHELARLRAGLARLQQLDQRSSKD